MSCKTYTPQEYDDLIDYVFSKEFNDWFNEQTKGDPYWTENPEKKKLIEDESNRRKAEWENKNNKS